MGKKLNLRQQLKNHIGLVLISGIVILLISQLAVFSQFYTIKIMRKGETSLADKSVLSDLKNKSALPDLINLDEVNEENLAAAKAYIKFKNIKESFIPTGIPEVYGQELSISFDKVQDAINKVRLYGPTYGKGEQKITLSGTDMERYKKIGESIACEYCCGVKTLTKPDGSAACGCAHSIMMRGLSAYLIKNHPEVTDEWILGELSKWKTTYFPKQTLSSELLALEKSGEEGIKEILQEFPDFLPQMVGGC